MNTFLTKLKLIYLPFLLLSAGFTISYSFLNWLLIIQLKVFSLNEELVNYWLPITLVLFPMFIWLRPRIKLLTLKDKKNNLPSLYFFVAWFAIGIPTVFAQEYLLTATGKLTILTNITEISKKSITKYYELKTHYVDKRHVALYQNTEVGGKNSEYLTFHIYTVCPILNHVARPDSVLNLNISEAKKPLIVVDGIPESQDLAEELKKSDISTVSFLKGAAATTLYGSRALNGVIIITTNDAYRQSNRSQPLAWLGKEYKKQISNNLSNEEKEVAYKAFYRETYFQFKKDSLNQFVYLDHIGTNDRSRGYRSAVKIAIPF